MGSEYKDWKLIPFSQQYIIDKLCELEYVVLIGYDKYAITQVFFLI
jgi:hypothetical protein